MDRIQRADLERLRSPRSMRRILSRFGNDRQMYPDEVVHRRGSSDRIVKTILEEYHPLAALAGHLRCVRGARLTPESNEGPDAEIWLWPRRRIAVQITCVDQSGKVPLQRTTELACGKIAGRGLGSAEGGTNARIQRIRRAIEKKSTARRDKTEVC